MVELNLKYDLTFADLYQRSGLRRLDQAFARWLPSTLRQALRRARKDPEALSKGAESTLLMELAPQVEAFLVDLFGLEKEAQQLFLAHSRLAPLYKCKRLFVQRQVARAYSKEEVAAFKITELEQRLRSWLPSLDDLTFATHVLQWLEDENETALKVARRYAAWRLHHQPSVLFSQPRKLDYDRLVQVQATAVEVDGGGTAALTADPKNLRARQGFSLTDAGADLTAALDEAAYCLYCHERHKDTCRTGMKVAEETFAPDPFGQPLAGCPLDQKISEMNLLKAQGHSVAALAMAVVDNPMLAATGHRICTDCMKSCIFQKQEPVDIPQLETRVLKDVIHLPWGFEIYSLLTRWNPLNLRRPLPAPRSGYKVLVVGMGPAGFTLAHHLMNAGHAVVGIDGLKIEPLSSPFAPIQKVEDLWQDLSERVMAGFGGVAEYGITSRWDKNFLTLVRLLLERRHQFTLMGGVRFGGTVTMAQAFAMGFDHIALCTGAGRPEVLDVKNNLARGVRQASDFLMALQLTGAAREQTLANLDIRLPLVVVGGGLTALDTATEALAFYPVLVERFRQRYEAAVQTHGEAVVHEKWSAADAIIAEEYLAHARALLQEKQQAAAEDRAPDILSLLKKWGGVKIAYRRSLQDSPAYRLNRWELEKALEEGIEILLHLSPQEILTDTHGHVAGLKMQEAEGKNLTLPARTVLVAVGTNPNTALVHDEPDLIVDGRFFRALDGAGAARLPELVSKPQRLPLFTHFQADGRAVSFLGDLHPSFHGSVVGAMASAKQGFPLIDQQMRARPATSITPAHLSRQVRQEWSAHLHKKTRRPDGLWQLEVHAPAAARNFQPGQFFRLQPYEGTSPNTLIGEPVAVNGFKADHRRGMLTLLLNPRGGSSEFLTRIEEGATLVCMGPCGAPTPVNATGTTLFVAEAEGLLSVLSVMQAVRDQGGQALLLTSAEPLPEARQLAQTCIVYEDLALDLPACLQENPEVSHLHVAGAPAMMQQVQTLYRQHLSGQCASIKSAVAGVHSPMQCMMKEICGQCLQSHVHSDGQTGVGHTRLVFSCVNQDQPLERVDFNVLQQRLAQNRVSEPLSRLWLEGWSGVNGLENSLAPTGGEG